MLDLLMIYDLKEQKKTNFRNLWRYWSSKSFNWQKTMHDLNKVRLWFLCKYIIFIKRDSFTTAPPFILLLIFENKGRAKYIIHVWLMGAASIRKDELFRIHLDTIILDNWLHTIIIKNSKSIEIDHMFCYNLKKKNLFFRYDL